ncbi:MAG: hypothetical protein J5482_02870 [Oscillospiraceae bacterium]|nr:hypothetical protein [Oscillospiraceae bacterium]
MELFSKEVSAKAKSLIETCVETREQEMGRLCASGHEVWGRLKECLELAEKEEKNAAKLHKEIWKAIVEKNEDEAGIELRELGKIAEELAMFWARAAAEAYAGGNEL